MKSGWLYLLLILAILLPGTRPCAAFARCLASSPVEGVPANDSSENSESEEEEVAEQRSVAVRFGLGIVANRSMDPRPVNQRSRFSHALSAAACVTLESRNGFGGHLTC